MTLVVTAVPVPDYGAASRYQPSINVDLTGIPFDITYTYTVYRNWEGKRDIVRGGRDVPVLGTVGFVVDYEAPFGESVMYQCVVFNAGGAVVEGAQSANVQLAIDKPWISDPFASIVATPVRLSRDSLMNMSYKRDGGPVKVVGASFPVAVVGLRHEAEEISITVQAADRAEAEATLTVLRNADPFLLRCPFDYPMPGLMYLTAETVAAVRYLRETGTWVTRITCTAAMVAPPVASAVIQSRTYANVQTEASSYVVLQTIYSDYISVLRGS